MIFFRPKFRKLRAERSTYSKVELNKLILKSLINSTGSENLKKLYFNSIFQNYSFVTSISLYKNVCLFKGHSHSVFRLFKLSRHRSKLLASNGFY